jgi:hypothetical protein
VVSAPDWLGEDEITWSLKPEAKLEIKMGERSLFRNFERAKFAYENRFDLPDPPPDVKIWFGNTRLGQVVVNGLMMPKLLLIPIMRAMKQRMCAGIAFTSHCRLPIIGTMVPGNL